jgi:hypothetical protein
MRSYEEDTLIEVRQRKKLNVEETTLIIERCIK